GAEQGAVGGAEDEDLVCHLPVPPFLSSPPLFPAAGGVRLAVVKQAKPRKFRRARTFGSMCWQLTQQSTILVKLLNRPGRPCARPSSARGSASCAVNTARPRPRWPRLWVSAPPT